MRLFLHTFLLLLFTQGLSAQEKITVKGIVKNNLGEPITDALIFKESLQNPITKTNRSGAFEFETIQKTQKYIISHIAYETDTLLIDFSDVRPLKYLNLDIVLSDRKLDEVIISAKKKPTVVHGDDQSSVHDFIHINDQWLLLSYLSSLNKNPILKLLSNKMKVLDVYEAPKKAIKFFKGYNQSTYLICEDDVYIVSAVQNEIRLRPVDEEEFYSQVYYVIDTINNQYIYKLNNMGVPSYTFYHQSLKDTVKHKFHESQDPFMMGLFRAEYKYAKNNEKRWALQQEINTGIDKELWIGKLKFTSSPYYKLPYAPLFTTEDQIILFDHCYDHVYTYSKDFEKVDSISVSYHHSKTDKNWKQPIIMDEEQKQWYALFESGGRNYLKFIDLTTGKTEKAFKLHYRFTENIQVINNYVYYIYRPYASSQRKYLYREELVSR